MVLISTIQNPPESAKEMVKRSMQLPRLPEFIKTKGPYIKGVVGQGVITLTIYEFEDVKFGEAFKHINKILGTFQGVPGYTGSVELWGRAKDVFEATGTI